MTMKKLLLVLSVLLLTSCLGMPDKVKPVNNFELNKYKPVVKYIILLSDYCDFFKFLKSYYFVLKKKRMIDNAASSFFLLNRYVFQ